MKNENWLEIGKYNLIMGNGFAEAYAYDKMTPEEKKQFDEYKKKYLEDALKDCTF